MDDDDSIENSKELDDSKSEAETSFKAFPLLNALSGFMMLPFNMLADRNTRKEVILLYNGISPRSPSLSLI